MDLYVLERTEKRDISFLVINVEISNLVPCTLPLHTLLYYVAYRKSTKVLNSELFFVSIGTSSCIILLL